MRELFEGVSLAAFAAGNRRIIKAVKDRTTTPEPDPCGHPDHKENPSHAEHCPSHPTPKTADPAGDAEHPFITWAKRIGGTVGALVLLWPILGKWVPTVAGGSLALWVIAALIAGQPAPNAEAAPEAATDGDDQAAADMPEDGDRPAPAAPTEADRARFAEALLRTVEYAVSTAKTEGRPGVHLSTLAEAVRQAGATGPVDDDRMATLLASLGVPVTSLSLGPKTARINRRGVRFDQLSEALGRAPRQDPAVAAAMATDLTPTESVA